MMHPNVVAFCGEMVAGGPPCRETQTPSSSTRAPILVILLHKRVSSCMS
jgi:hypothetical protein